MIKRKLTIAVVLAIAAVGCAQRKLPCVAKVYVEQVPVIHRVAILPIDDRGVMDRPIPRTVGMGHYERTKDSGAMLRDVLKFELENAAGLAVIDFKTVDAVLDGRIITADELTNTNGEEPIEIGLRLGADVVVAGRVRLCGEEDAPKSPRSYVVGELYMFESRSGRLIAGLEMMALDYPESCRYIAHKMCTKLCLMLRQMKQAALERENKLQHDLYRKRNPLPHTDRY
ncbi:MAG: hypothetical protein GXP25_24020 [Planctomycetes bacterium]|nr:hypothetical protein [Planctomycetota bacterium]